MHLFELNFLFPRGIFRKASFIGHFGLHRTAPQQLPISFAHRISRMGAALGCPGQAKKRGHETCCLAHSGSGRFPRKPLAASEGASPGMGTAAARTGPDSLSFSSTRGPPEGGRKEAGTHLEDVDGEGVLDEDGRGEHHAALAALVVGAADQVQLGVHPEQPPADEVCKGGQLRLLRDMGPPSRPQRTAAQEAELLCRDSVQRAAPPPTTTKQQPLAEGGGACRVTRSAAPTDGESVGPQDVRRDDGRPVRAVHAGALNLGLLAPVRPEHPAAPREREEEEEHGHG